MLCGKRSAFLVFVSPATHSLALAISFPDYIKNGGTTCDKVNGLNIRAPHAVLAVGDLSYLLCLSLPRLSPFSTDWLKEVCHGCWRMWPLRVSFAALTCCCVPPSSLGRASEDYGRVGRKALIPSPKARLKLNQAHAFSMFSCVLFIYTGLLGVSVLTGKNIRNTVLKK